MRILAFACIILLLPSPIIAQNELGIFSPSANIVIATYEKIYSFNEDYVEIYLGKELSYAHYYNKPYNKIHQFSITTKYVDGDTWEEACLLLPEIGNWSVAGHHKKKLTQEYVAKNIVLELKCEIYDSNDVIYVEYSPIQKLFAVEYNYNKYISSNWNCYYFGNRPSTENLCHMRYARDNIYHKEISDKKFEMFITRDSNDDSTIRLLGRYDDLFFYHNNHVKDNHPADLTCFIVPRIFFIKFEESSFSFDIMDDLSLIRFTIIVQQFETPEKTIWNYHRLEIVRKQSAHEIQINDLGPVPRVEWDPGWPDPATTPLWVEPKSECEQCQ